MAQPTTYTVTAPARVPVNGFTSDPYVVTIGAGDPLTAPVVITPASNLAGFFVPNTVTLDSRITSASFRFVPQAAGATTLSFTNNGTLSNAANITPTVAAATVPTTVDPVASVSWAAVGGASYYEVHVNGEFFARTTALAITVPLQAANGEPDINVRVSAYADTKGLNPVQMKPLATGSFSTRLLPNVGNATLALVTV